LAPTPALATGGQLPVDIPPAQRMAIAALSANLGVPGEQIKIVTSEAVEWPDGCLGVRKIGVMCTEAIVPGFRIVLEALGQQYEAHTNADGTVVRFAGAPAGAANPAQSQVAKTLADTLHIDENAITVVSSAPIEWPDACLGIAQPGIVCAQVITPGYLFVLAANGRQYEYHTDKAGSQVAPATLVLVWHREGGIVGFCDDLTIYQAGEIQASWCKPKPGVSNGSLSAVLSADERAQFNQWLTDFGEVNVTQKDPAVADAMTVTLTLYGHGAGKPTAADQQAMLTFAQTVLIGVQP
jgi:hypothetical protein